MKKMKKMMLSVLPLILLAPNMAGCGRSEQTSSVVEDVDVSRIALSDGTSFIFEQHFVTENNPDATLVGLSIDTYNKENQKVKTIKYEDDPKAFSYSKINTDTIGDNFSFTLTYTKGGNKFDVVVPYSVKAARIKSWSLNKEYADWQSTNKTVNPAMNITEKGNDFPFMKVSKFYVGNQNVMNLFPVCQARDIENVLGIDTLKESDVEIELYQYSAEESVHHLGNKANLVEYLDNVSLLKTKGTLKFKEGKTGSFVLVFKYTGSGTKTDFPDLYYELEVTDGYNINEAKDLFVLSNDDVDDDYVSEAPGNNDNQVRKWKEDNHLPTFEKKYHRGIIQKNLVLTGDDIPDTYIWGKGLDSEGKKEVCNDTIKGSLKDYSFLIKRTFIPTDVNTEYANVDVYGNFHTLSIDEDKFPKILKEGTDDGTAEGAKVEGHSTLFGSVYSSPEENGDDGNIHCNYNLHDLHLLGNQGVSKEDNGKTGLIALKHYSNATIDNCLVNRFYNAVVACKSSDDNGGHTLFSTNDSRYRDTYNSMLFGWNSAAINIQNSELQGAGGPLIFAQCHMDDNAGYPDWGGITSPNLTKVVPGVLTIDDKSYLNNPVAGVGGWFKQYNAEDLFSTQFKPYNKQLLAATGNKTSFLDNGFTAPDDSGTGQFNFLALVMPNGGGVQATSGAVLGKVTIDGGDVIDYDGGRLETLGKLPQGDYSGLWTTEFGMRAALSLMLEQAQNAAVLSAYDKTSNKHAYASINPTTGTMVNLESLLKAAMPSLGTASTSNIDDIFKTTDYLGVSMVGSNLGFNPADISQYLGPNTYTMLIKAMHNTTD